MRNRLAFLLLLVVPAVAHAHAMLLTVEVKATEVRVAVRYDGADHGSGGPSVSLLRLPGKELVEKKPTDKAGVAVFARPAAGRYLVVAEDEFHDATKEIDVTAEEARYADEPRNKWLMILIGVLVIGGLTAAGWYFSKAKRNNG